MKVLIVTRMRWATIANAFLARGHKVDVVDLAPFVLDDYDYREMWLRVVHSKIQCWDLMIAHPPCTHLSVSGLHWNHRYLERQEKTDQALQFVRQLMSLVGDERVKRYCIENPVSCISTRIRKPDQYIHPYEFGHDASKRTGLWLSGLKPLIPTKIIAPSRPDAQGRIRRWGNQDSKGQNNEGTRNRTGVYSGIAKAMADQWG